MSTASCPVSAIVTAFARLEVTLKTIERLRDCRPTPAEILVHVDGGGEALAAAIRERFPEVLVMVSDARVGPGGGRNRLLREASCGLVASFDDDSYPADGDFFQRVMTAAEADPETAVFAALILDGTAVETEARQHPARVASFVGCGCVYRRDVFLSTSGYVPLPLAYGMEEVDLSIRLHAQGRHITFSPSLRVVHELDLQHRRSEVVAAAMVANVALFVFLRYPVFLWPLGVAQCMRKALELLLRGHWGGVLFGLRGVPAMLWRHRHLREALPARAVWSYFILRRRSCAARTTLQ